jgi:putative pyruvate formate lyase activating enzyme
MPSRDFVPAYVKTFEKGLLRDRIATALELLEACTVCPRQCRCDRTAGDKGFCGAGYLPEVSSFGPHFGEERPLVGRGGSGTIFMTHCNLGCVFCQNSEISRHGMGETFQPDDFSRIMIELQRRGCHNINFVSPTHFVPQILQALPKAIEGGLRLPLVYNTGGYDAVEVLGLLDGIVDIYMPDFKFTDPDTARIYSEAPDYPQTVKAALKEMHRQTGDLVTDERGIALRGLLVRHLVLPGGLAGTREAMRFLASEISKQTYVNIMNQYRPCGDIKHGDPLARRIAREEFETALQAAKEEGIRRIDGEV